MRPFGLKSRYCVTSDGTQSAYPYTLPNLTIFVLEDSYTTPIQVTIETQPQQTKPTLCLSQTNISGVIRMTNPTSVIGHCWPVLSMLLHRTKIFKYELVKFKYGPVKSIALYILPNLSIFVLEDEHCKSSPPFYKISSLSSNSLSQIVLGGLGGSQWLRHWYRVYCHRCA